MARTVAIRALLLLSAAGAAAVCSQTTTASAAEEKGTPVDVESLKRDLETGQEATMLAALEKIAETADAALAPLVNGVLARGSTPKVIEAALVAAGKLKAESSSEVIGPYVSHRVESIRREATKALLKTRGAAAVTVLRRALRSGDAAVRGIAATGLGALGAHEALDDLTRALDQGVGEAAASIGQLCKASECGRLADRLGKVQLDILTTGFDQVLFRPPTEIEDDEKLRLIGRLRELGTAPAGDYLADVAGRWPKDWSAKVKQALDAALKALGKAGGS